MNARHTLARGFVASFLCLSSFAVASARAQEVTEDYQLHRDVSYGQVDGRTLFNDAERLAVVREFLAKALMD